MGVFKRATLMDAYFVDMHSQRLIHLMILLKLPELPFALILYIINMFGGKDDVVDLFRFFSCRISVDSFKVWISNTLRCLHFYFCHGNHDDHQRRKFFAKNKMFMQFLRFYLHSLLHNNPFVSRVFVYRNEDVHSFTINTNSHSLLWW